MTAPVYRGESNTPVSRKTDGAAMSRRTILKAGAVLGGGFLLGFNMPSSEAASTGARTGNATFAPNAFIRIDRDGKVTLIMPQAEMGQGVYTSHAMILAEELDAAFDQVTVEASPPSDALYGNPVFHLQATGNSNSIRAFWLPLRKAGAGARAMLVAAAAATWRVDAATCRTENSEVIHDPSGRRLGYGALAAQAAAITPPATSICAPASASKKSSASLPLSPTHAIIPWLPPGCGAVG